MSKFEAVIFDMDGTLIDSESFALRIWTKALKEYGFLLSEEMFVSMIGTSTRQCNRLLQDAFGPELAVEDLRIRKCEIELEALLTEKIALRSGVKELLDHFVETKVPFGLATSSERVRGIARLKSSDLLTYFNFAIFGDEVENQKPNPEIYLSMAKSLNVDIKNTLVIEDSPSGVMGALSAGATVYWFKDLVEINDDLKLKVRSINSMLEVIPEF